MFFERLEIMCSCRGCKPNTIAAHLGLSNATATKWKKGSIPNGETLTGIADYLDCSIDYLLGRTDNPESHKIPVESIGAAFVAALDAEPTETEATG